MSLTFFDAFTRFGPKPSVHGSQPWSLDHLLTEMRHCSISGALVASTACIHYDAMLENRRLVERIREHDHLFPIWNAMPHWTGEFPEPAELTREMRGAGVRAVTLHPRFNGWDLLSESSRPLLEELERTRTLVIIDMRSEIDEPALETITARHPEMRVLLFGVSWTRQRSVIPILLRRPNVHIAFDHFQINRGLETLVAMGCEDQLVYASNATDMSMGAHRMYVDYADLPLATRRKIAGGNLTRLLGGLEPPRLAHNPAEDAIMAEAREGAPLSDLVIDFHAHMLDNGLHGGGGAYTMFGGDAPGQRALAERMGVDGVGIMSWNGTVGVHADEGNACVRTALDQLPDTWWGLASFDVIRQPPDEIRARLAQEYADPRFLGLKPYIRYGKHYDDPVHDPLWEFGEARGLYALLHPCRDDLSEFDALCPRYPGLTFVAPHCGASYEMADRAIARARKYPNFLIEITLTPVCLGVVDYLVEGAGADRVLYGSDQPMRDPRQQLGWVVYSRMPVEQKRMVLGQNAQRLLAGIRARQAAAAGG